MLPGVGVFGTGQTVRALVPLLQKEGFPVQAVWGLFLSFSKVCEARVYGGSLLSQSYGWAWEELMGGGGLHTVGSCIIDLLSHLTGRRAVRVHGMLRTFVRQGGPVGGIRSVTADDYACFQLLMNGGVVCSVTLNFNLPGTDVHEI
ncbi:glucose-fructose oxidoreductase domain-containing protein 2-like, partial [Sinocyclocheilus grahami]|uniref:glucose-fructose oxidoreductase domain-containing protein 2-like n=1 Tax=Sinocyclocheilus grahami TaxID=75366 RepID=UPI0007AC9153